jgi:hypothetical protein
MQKNKGFQPFARHEIYILRKKRSFRMKNKKFSVLLGTSGVFLVFVVLTVLAGCGSTQKAGSRGKDPVMLDHAGRAWGEKEVPPWLQTWNKSKSIIAVQKLPEYRGLYCFIAEDTGSNLKAVQAWLNTVAINDTIGSQFSTRLGALADVSRKTANNASYTNKLDDAITVTRDATYSAAVKESEYWVLWRIYDPDDKTKYTDEYTATVLYTMKKDIMDQQIGTMITNFMKNANTAEERAMWTGLIQAVVERGLDVEARTPAQNDGNVNITVFN